MAASIQLIVSEGSEASASRFFELGQSLLALLDDFAGDQEMDWTIEDLQLGSAVVQIAPSIEHEAAGAKVIGEVRNGVACLQRNEPLPHTWSARSVGHLHSFIRKADDGTSLMFAQTGPKKLEPFTITIDDVIRERVAMVMPPIQTYWGAVRGQVVAVSFRKGNQASLLPFTGDKVVEVRFTNTQREFFKQALLEDVEVEGLIHTRSGQESRRIEAETAHRIPRDEMSWSELFGLIPEITEGKSVKDYLEDIRGEVG